MITMQFSSRVELKKIYGALPTWKVDAQMEKCSLRGMRQGALRDGETIEGNGSKVIVAAYHSLF